MTHSSNPELLNTVLQLLNEQGSDGLAEVIRLLVDEAMRQGTQPRGPMASQARHESVAQ